MPDLTGILEAAVYVDDLDKAESFYGGVLGLERITRADGRHVFYRCGAGTVLVFVAEQSAKPPASGALPVPPHGAVGPGHMALAADESALDDWRKHFEDNGIDVEADFRWPHGKRSIYVRDPAGNSIEIADRHLWDKQT